VFPEEALRFFDFLPSPIDGSIALSDASVKTRDNDASPEPLSTLNLLAPATHRRDMLNAKAMLLKPTSLCFAALLTFGGIMAFGQASSSGLLLATNKGAHTLSLIDVQSGKQIAVIPEGGVTGHEVAASPDGRTAYVPIYGNSGVGKPGTDGNKIAVIDLASRKIVHEINFDRGVRPHCAVVGPKDGLLYVTTELEKAVTVIDPKTYKILGTISTGQPESHMLALSDDGRRGYTANVGPGTVSVLDIEARKLVTVIHISKETQRISVTPDGSMVFTADQTKPRLAVIDTASNKVKSWIDLPAIGFGTTVTHDGKWLLATLPSENKVAVIDLGTLKVDHTVDVPSSPQEILVRPDNQVAYVSCDHSQKVASIDLSNWKVDQLIDAGKEVDGLAWAANQQAAQTSATRPGR
jgi:DNA-binding beta-propeller fold protein YncE